MVEAPLTTIVAQLHAELPALEREVRAEAPGSSDAAVRDVALQRAIARLRLELTADTLNYVRGYMQRMIAEASAIREASARTRERVAADRKARREQAEVRAVDPFVWQPPDDAREFVDEDGRLWRVHEVRAAHVPGSRGTHCLIFFARDTLRRVWRYPADWCDLSDLGLAALCAGRAPQERAD
jgi:hypothetical protein